MVLILNISWLKTKLNEIETYQLAISKSLYSPGQSDPDTTTFTPGQHLSVTKTRRQSFQSLHKVINSFTDYEKFLYYDNQQNLSSSAAPSLGKNYVEFEPLAASSLIKKKDVEFIEKTIDKQTIEVATIIDQKVINKSTYKRLLHNNV